jgi:dihydropteroate synthase/2-amino-4-hydroxy-6-hydroxymethyldihydropteridine diphosphokinase
MNTSSAGRLERESVLTSWQQLWNVQRGGHSTATDHSIDNKKDNDDTTTEPPYRVYLAVGSNLGNRFDNIRQALHMLCHNENRHNTTILTRTSFLHETPPMYVTDQPAFLNGAVQLDTYLPAPELLQRLKDIEAELGRNTTSTIRNGPRPVDLDIIMYEKRNKKLDTEAIMYNDDHLVVPHPRMQERNFVLQPLMEINADLYHPILRATVQQLQQRLFWETQSQEDTAIRVLPLPRNRYLYFNETIVMGILNVTPDSFSDGGNYNDSVEQAAQHALHMAHNDGAKIIDIGGESTRPGAKPVSVQEELDRTLPVIRRIRELSSDIILSIDTRRAAVAKAAVEAGCDIVNDVSGGSYDGQMLSTVAALGVPMILMHMRGTPETMTTLTEYGNVVTDVAEELVRISKRAECAGIPRWLQIVDPGIGFAKDLTGNLVLLQNVHELRSATQGLPLLLGTSRKGFLGTLTGVSEAAERDFATVASCITALCLEPTNSPTILRVHNPAAMSQAVKVMDAIRQAGERKRQ